MYFPIVDKRNREIAFGGATLTDNELIGKVHSAAYHQCQQWVYAAPVDVLMVKICAMGKLHMGKS